MKFKKIVRPKLTRAVKPKILRSVADRCPWCGAIESLRANRTKRTCDAIYRYSKCVKCGKPVTRVVRI